MTISGQDIDIPQPGAAAETNGADLVGHANNCTQIFNRIPNFVAVDFYEKGSVLQTVAQLNGVQWNGKLPTSATVSGNSGVSTIAATGVSAVAVSLAAAAAVLGLVTF